MLKSILLLLLTFFGVFGTYTEDLQFDAPTTEVQYGEKLTYTIVEPTQEELDGIEEKLCALLGNRSDNYNCTENNVYEYIFEWGNLNYASPKYDKEAAKYISEPMDNPDYDRDVWFSYVYDNDPRGLFGKLPDELFDENGNYDESRQFLLKEGTLLGYTIFPGRYVDWLIEGVWNGKVNHESFMQFGIEYAPGEYSTELYYHSGYYYTPYKIFGLGGPEFWSEIREITPTGDGKYEVKFDTTMMEDSPPDYFGTAIVAMKEASNGFRFWSIYSIEYQENQNIV